MATAKITHENNTVSHVFEDSSGNIDIEKTVVLTRENTHFLPSAASASHEFAVENILFFHLDDGKRPWSIEIAVIKFYVFSNPWLGAPREAEVTESGFSRLELL